MDCTEDDPDSRAENFAMEANKEVAISILQCATESRPSLSRGTSHCPWTYLIVSTPVRRNEAIVAGARIAYKQVYEIEVAL